MLVERVLLVAKHPGIRQRVVDPVHQHVPRRIRDDDVRHLPVERRALRAVGQLLRFLEQRVVFGQVEARIVVLSDPLAVQEAEERFAFADRREPSESPHLQRALLCLLQQFRPGLFLECHPDADRIHVLLPQFRDLAIARHGRASLLDRQWLAAGELAIAVAIAVLEAELVEQYFRRSRVVLELRLRIRIMAGDVRRHRLERREPLALVADADHLFGVEAERHRATQRNLLALVAADNRIVHVEVSEDEAGLGDAEPADPALRVFRLQLAVDERAIGHRVRQLFVIGLAAVECQQARIVFFDDADLDAPDRGQLLALHLRHDRLVGRVGAVRERHVAKRRIGLEQDLVRAFPVFQQVGTGADRIAHRPRVAFGAVLVDDFAGDGGHRRLRHVVHQPVVRFDQLEPDRVAVDRLHAFDLGVVVELAGLLRLLHHTVGADELFVNEIEVRRTHTRIEQTLPRIDVVVGGELTLLAAKCRIVGELNPFLELDRPRQSVGADLWKSHRCIRDQLVRTCKIVVLIKRIEDVPIDKVGIKITDCLRIESGFGDLERNAERLVHVGGERRTASEHRQDRAGNHVAHSAACCRCHRDVAHRIRYNSFSISAASSFGAVFGA